MILVEQLTKKFNNTTAVNAISFEVKEGETLVLLGTSGCGKTTTLKMINRLIEPTSGKVLIGGKNIYTQPAEILRRSIGYVLQNNGLFPHYTVAQNIAVVPQLLHWDATKIEQRITTLLQKLQLPESILQAYPNELSGGQQQRVGLARALAADPPILLMDEPFGALDPITKAGIRKEFIGLDELKRKTIVLVTHDIHEAFEMGDRICLMEGGSIMQIGTPADLLFHPATEFVQRFLAQHRLELELRAIKLQHIWEDLNTVVDMSASNTMPATKSLWEAMETISVNRKEYITVSNKAGERKRTDFNDLVMALNNYKKRQ